MSLIPAHGDKGRSRAKSLAGATQGSVLAAAGVVDMLVLAAPDSKSFCVLTFSSGLRFKGHAAS